ncbi:hypothetical protein [Bosea sp. TAB14]|uniref:hypothetical protein n=1 Tax=Bosea sp. TAB14 TaxID=3237481 RepID=UPI003F93D03B
MAYPSFTGDREVMLVPKGDRHGAVEAAAPSYGRDRNASEVSARIAPELGTDDRFEAASQQ